MTAHSHRSLPPSLCSFEQVHLVGAPHQWVKVGMLVDAFWNECEQCKPGAVEAVVADHGAFLALWRICTLQETGTLRRPHGSAEAEAEQQRLQRFDEGTLRSLVDAGARMWVSRARLFAEIDSIGKCDGEGRVLERPRVNRPGQRHRRR